MTRIRTAALLAIDVLAISAYAAASASAALPEFSGPLPAPFGAKSGLTTLETVKGAKITCTADTGRRVDTVDLVKAPASARGPLTRALAGYPGAQLLDLVLDS